MTALAITLHTALESLKASSSSFECPLDNLQKDASAIACKPYSAEAYNSLLLIHEAAIAFHMRGGTNLLTEINNIFIRYKVQSFLGLSLVHRHFDIQADQIVVMKKGAAEIWNKGHRVEKTVQPTMWTFSSGGLMPVGFEAVEGEAFGQSKSLVNLLRQEASFVQEMETLLRERGFENILGLCALESANTERWHLHTRACPACPRL